MSFAVWLNPVSSSSSPAHWTTWWRHASWRSTPCRQRRRENFRWVPPYSRPRRRVGHRLRRCWPWALPWAVGKLSLGRSIGLAGPTGGVATGLLLILPNNVFSGWSRGGRLIVHAKTIVPVGVMDEPALVSLVERSKHSFDISGILVRHCSGGGGEEVFGEVAALAPLLGLRRLGRLLPSLSLRLFLRDLLLASVLNAQLRSPP